ncbi:MAG: CPBP family intramembrane metalloprotease [Anaerolineales bacterium]|nr:CPBP family intramembrane metalloprotease [Anaerolineales bacterium]
MKARKKCRAGQWYFIGPAIVAAYLLAAFAVNLLLGAKPASPFPVPDIGTFIMLLLMGGLWEESGWTGYALPKLQERFAPLSYGTLAATLSMGFFRSIWHLPLVLSGAIACYDAVFFTWRFKSSSSGSISNPIEASLP